MNVKYKKYIEYIVNDIELPYLKYLEQYGLKDDEYKLVLSKIYDQPVTIKFNSVYDTNGKVIYWENSNGSWEKREYDEQCNLIYSETSNGGWYKYVYNNQGNKIYYETNNGYWAKYEYDKQGNNIYYENSDGSWINQEYDTNGKVIYWENSNGFIRDNR